MLIPSWQSALHIPHSRYITGSHKSARKGTAVPPAGWQQTSEQPRNAKSWAVILQYWETCIREGGEEQQPERRGDHVMQTSERPAPSCLVRLTSPLSDPGVSAQRFTQLALPLSTYLQKVINNEQRDEHRVAHSTTKELWTNLQVKNENSSLACSGKQGSGLHFLPTHLFPWCLQPLLPYKLAVGSLSTIFIQLSPIQIRAKHPTSKLKTWTGTAPGNQ